MAVRALARVVARAPVPVFAVAGIGARTALLGLRADDRVMLVSSPRHATVLLLAGAMTDRHAETLAHVHDQLPDPRVAVWWGGDDTAAIGISDVVPVAASDDVVAEMVRVHGQLLSGHRSSSPRTGPATSPVSWRGVGPHGQGGEGMMGGHPYGRPMAMTGPDLRDGLHLDRVTLPVGPALPGLPPGLGLVLKLQGDVIQQVELAADPFASGAAVGTMLPSVTDVFDAARSQPVPIAELEVARARVHLLRVADALALYGLAAAARRTARLALHLDPSDIARLRRLDRWLARTAALWGATSGVGRIDAGEARDVGLAGLAARAAGLATDARADEPGYRAAGFAVQTRTSGDAFDRWRLRLDEAIQSLGLATASGSTTVGPGGVEDPRRDAAAILDHLPHWLTGLEWGDAVTTIASLDLDLEAAVDRSPASPSGSRR